VKQYGRLIYATVPQFSWRKILSSTKPSQRQDSNPEHAEHKAVVSFRTPEMAGGINRFWNMYMNG
jgi:hypothetical protein